jgi:hypothetical protein
MVGNKRELAPFLGSQSNKEEYDIFFGRVQDRSWLEMNANGTQNTKK